MNRDRLLLDAVTAALTTFQSAGASPAFDRLLAAALSVTDSEHGVIAEILDRDAGRPRFGICATTLPWDETAATLPAETEDVRRALQAGLRSAAQAGGTVDHPASTEAALSSASGPPIHVLGLPLHGGKGLVGVMALATRRGPYSSDPVALLQPLLTACSSLIEMTRAPREPTGAEARPDQELHRTIVETAVDAIVTITDEGVIESINPAGEQMFGYRAEELVGRKVNALLPEPYRSDDTYLQRYLETGIPRVISMMARRRDASEFPVELAVAESRLPGRRLFTGFVRDVTRRRAAERALRESEERYRLFMEHSLQGICIHVDGIIRVANPALARMHGYADAAELVDQPYWIYLHPEERARVEAYREARLRGEPVASFYERRHVRKDGSTIWVQAASTVIPWEARKAVMVTCVDITERRRVEDALRVSEERLALAVGGADLGVWDWNVQTGEVAFNDRWAAMLGYDVSEIEPHVRSWERLVHPDDMPEVQRVLQDHLDGRTPFYRTEHRLRTKTGSWKWVLDHGRIVSRDPDGAPLRAVGIHQDISPRKEAELALRKSHDDLVAVLNQLRMAVVVTDAGGRIAFLSDSCAGIEGIDTENALGQGWDAVFPFDERSRDQVREAMQLDAEQRTRLTLRMQTRSGRVYHLECDVGDDPRAPFRRILYLYDVTETRQLRARLDLARFGQMVGASPATLRVFEMIQRVAEGRWTVLIEGETGVGKELVARAIHAASPRRHGPFVAVNCAGLTESLLASQLFGHRKGAFTGAVADQQGFFEAASGGTIFLDEIGDVPPAMQAALLRVLEEREITRVGEARPRKVDVRVLAATNRDLAREVTEGRFREDLLYRVRVARVAVPPLRERREDIPLLVSAFLAEIRLSAGKAVAEVSAEAMRILENHSWPGNVRELRHALDHAVIHCRGQVIQPDDLPPEILAQPLAAEPTTPVAAEPSVSGEDERARILSALKRARGNRTQAAKLLHVSRATLYRRLEELSLTKAR